MDVEGIILAAGLSTRAGSFKMTLEFNGKTVIENTIDNMLESCKKIFVVGGHRIEELRPIVQRYSNVELAYNQDYLQGMYTSVKKGMSCISSDKFFFTPGDYPLIMPCVYQELLRYDAPVVVPTFEERRGHPVLFDRVIIDQVVKGNDFKTLRDVINKNQPVMVRVDCSGILMDLDTIEDYQLLLRHIG